LGAEPLSLSAPINTEGEADLNDFLADDNCVAPLEEAVRTQSADELREILTTLNAREQRILELRFGFADGEEQTLEQISKEFSLTRERIRQIETRAIAKLRNSPLVAELALHSN
jgi:RNA polymerase primary sigma factor